MPTRIRLATFNAENLFNRPRVMRYTEWAAGKAVLADFATLSSLIQKDTYTAAIKATLKTLLNRYIYGKAPKEGRTIKLNEVRGKLAMRKQGTTTITANGRADWVGWFELIRDDLGAGEVINTGRVINAVRPDVLCLVEVEDRLSLVRFNDQVLQYEFQYPFRTNMLVDGNDDRGIDIGCFSQLPIISVRSHVDLPMPGATTPVFSRDCPEFEIALPGGQTLILLGNHLKSQGYGSKAANDAKRLAQSTAVAQLYQAARQRSPYVVVAGDLNAGSTDATLAPLIQGTDLKDVMMHPLYVNGPDPLPGTFDTGTTDKKKFDYILLAPALWGQVQQVGVERRGTWRGPTKPHFPEVTAKTTQASDHACVWVDVNL
jgi:endonuclease/exonuclease/phosphatase family metal-dependent hydrolase